MNTVTSLKTVSSNVRSRVEGALEDTGGLLRLAPCWVPRSFLQPGKRLKLHPDDLYAYGLNRGGIDERWFASTTPAANDNRTEDEGLSYVVVGGRALHPAAGRRARAARCSSARRSGANTRSGRSTRSSSTTWGRSRITCTRVAEQAALVGQEGKPESYYFPPQHNNVGQQLSLHLHGLRARHDEGAGAQVPGELEQGRQRHPRSLARPIA